MESQVKVSVVIVNWNTCDLLKQCLEALESQTASSLEIFVVDNASSDGSPEMVREHFPDVQLIANQRNRGFAAANNQALDKSSGQYILLLNPDTKVLDGAVDKLVAFLDKESTVGACTSMLLNGDGSLQKNVGNFYSFWGTLLENRIVPRILPNNKFLAKKFVAFWDHTTQRDIDWARGAVLLFHRKVLDQVGLLDEQFYIYGEEIDYCWRIKKKGWRIVYLPAAKIIHYGQAASSQRKQEMFIQNYKSFYILLKKHYPVYSYLLYRARATLYLLPWLLKLALAMLVRGHGSPKRTEAASLMRVYLASLRWHFSAESLVRLTRPLSKT